MITPQNFDKWMFDYFEGNLSADEVSAFEKFIIDNPEYEMDMDAMEQSFVQAAPVEYPNIHNLERNRKVAGAWYGWAAAVFVIGLSAFGVYQLTSSNLFQVNDQSQVALFLPENSTQKQVGVKSDNTLWNNAVSEELTTTNRNNNATRFNFSNNSTAFSNQPTIQSNLNVSSNNSIEQDLNEELGKTSNSEVQFTDAAINQEQNKLMAEEGNGTYKNNPEVNPLGYKSKYKKDYNTFWLKVNRVYRKIEKMMGYPVGLENLRDPELIIPTNNVLSNNPGFAGGMLTTRFDMNYRNQWYGSSMNSQALSLGFDSYNRELRGGVGFQLNVMDYGMGDFNEVNFNVFYSPKIKLSEDAVLEPGIKMTMGTITANANNLISGNNLELNRGQILNIGDLSNISGSQKLWYKDYSLGAVLNTTWFYMGLSADNLGRHYNNVFVEENGLPSRANVKYSAVIGGDYMKRTENVTLSPFVSFTQIGNYQELWGGVNLRLKNFMIGGSYSNLHDYAGVIGLKFPKFKMIYRYDNIHSILTNEQIASHNIGIRFNTEKKSSRIR